MIVISKTIKDSYPKISLGVIEASVAVSKSDKSLIAKMEQYAGQFAKANVIEDIAKIDAIKDTRAAYRAFGKQPARYRVSSEAMLRRIIQGKGLYYINNVVDVNNLVSIQSGYGICCFDRNKIAGCDIWFTIAEEGETYQGIGKSELNISRLPVFKDNEGSFGSPTSDSQRTMISEQTNEILFLIVSFSGSSTLKAALNNAEQNLKLHCKAIIKSKGIIE